MKLQYGEKEQGNEGINRWFVCKNCGKIVTVPQAAPGEEPVHDRRWIFCSQQCARTFWRKPKKIQQKRENRAAVIAASIRNGAIRLPEVDSGY